MANRQSSLSPLALASLRSRFASASRSVISWALFLCALSHPFFCQSLKLIGASDQKDLLPLHNPANEVILRSPLRSKFAGAQYKGIDLPTQSLLHLRKQRRYVFQGKVIVHSDNHHVHVTGFSLFAPRKGTKGIRHDNPIVNWH